jgi:hypothetical protein
MKKLLKIFSLLLVINSSTFAGTTKPGGDLDAEKSKTYTKSYPVATDDKISLSNSFGEMKISTWAKNEIKVDVTITVKAGTDERAQKILDIIHIEDGKNGSDIFFKTHLNNDDNDGHRSNREKNEHTSFKINYTVYLPATATLDATDQFGALIIGDYDGPVSLNSKFGSLTAGVLNQAKKIKVEFGKANIKAVNNGSLSIQFSKAEIEKLSGDISASFNQSHGVKIGIGNSLKKMEINNNFSHILLDADKNLSANFDIKTSFGGFTNKSDFQINKNDDGERRYFNKNNSYSGKAGNGDIPVKIKSNFGSITLGYDLPFDMNEKSDHTKKSKA